MGILSFIGSPWVFLFFAALGQFSLSQKENGLTLVPAFLFFTLAIVGLKRVWRPGKKDQKIISPRLEALAFAGIVGVAVGFRIFRIDVFPSGISVDQAIPALGSLKVLDGWRPVFETPILNCPSLIFYLEAAWFKFFPPTQVLLAFFCVTLSLAVFPFVYWTFRQLAGPGPALLTVAFLAIARWDIFLGRWAGIFILPGLFIYGTLAFWLRGLSSGKTWPYLAAGLSMGLGLYGYFAYRPFPILMAGFATWEIRHHPENFRRDWAKWLGMFLLSAALAFPLLWHWSHEPNFGQSYPNQEFIGSEVLSQKSFMPLVKNALDFLAMFSRKGDSSPKQTADFAPMLDGVTAALAVLGLAGAFFNLKKRSSVYPLVLFAGLSLNNVLSTAPANICHVLPLLPCVLFWSGSTLWHLNNLKESVSKPWKWAVAGSVFVLAAGLNYHQLFDVQARGKANPAVFDLGPTLAGQQIAREGSQYDFVLCPRFGLHFTVLFLANSHQADFRKWDWPRDLALPSVSPGKKGVVFLMDEGDGGILKFLQFLYPRCQAETEKDPQGLPLFHTLYVSREKILAARGLREVGSQGAGQTFPLFPDGLPPGPLAASFSGCLFIPRSGPQLFWADPAEKVSWKIDGGPVPNRKLVSLERGFHSLEIRLKSPDASRARFWTRGPDGNAMELDSSRLTTLPLGQGLEASYYQPQAGGETLVYRQWDPLVNFTNRTDLALFAPPLSIRWSGKLWIPRKGPYDFLVLTEPSDRAQVKLDGKAVTPMGPVPSGSVELGRGWHRLSFEFNMGGDFLSAVSLAWKKPGDTRYEIISPQNFGPVAAESRP